MTALLQDLRYALRAFHRAPGFTALALITLALGIGANTAIFSVVNAVLFRPLPFHEPERLVLLRQSESAPGNYPMIGQDYLDWRAGWHTLEAGTLYTWPNSINVSGQDEPERAMGIATDANFFSVLGVRPLLGRTFGPGEDQEGRNHIAVLSYGFWAQHFGARPEAVGQTLRLNEETYTVIGVMPPDFNYPAGTGVWTPLDMSPKNLGSRGNHSYRAIGRLKPGVTPIQAQADLEVIAKRLEQEYPESNFKVGAVVLPLEEAFVGGSRTQLLVLWGAAGLVLLIACANVGNLLLARATGQNREIAVRQALGASRGRLVRQLLTESVLLALAGAAAGTLVAVWGVNYLKTSAALPIPQLIPISVDARVLGFTIAISFAVGILFGLAPALQGSRLNLNDELKSGGRSVAGASGRRRTLRDALVAAEIAVSLALLVGAGLLVRSLVKLRRVDAGVRADNVLTMKLSLPAKKYATLGARTAFFDALLGRLRNSAGIESAAISSELPLEGGTNGYIKVDGVAESVLNQTLVEWNNVSPEYFRTFGIPLLAGRTLDAADAQAATKVWSELDALYRAGKLEGMKTMPADVRSDALINQTMAKKFWPGRDAVGQVFHAGGIPVTVIGVVGDVKQFDLRGETIPQAYFSAAQLLVDTDRTICLAVRSAGTPALITATAREQVKELDPDLPVYSVRPMQQVFADSFSGETSEASLVGLFAALALVLATAGIYGVMSYVVSQQVHEIGVRMTLGAQPGQVLGMVLRRGAQIAGWGIAAGLVATFWLSRLLERLLFGVHASDALTYVGAAAVLFGVALAACLVPAVRAMRVDPMLALRYE